MEKLNSLSVFFPAYNEEENIVQTVEKALRVIPSFADTFEVIVINDGSGDRTKELAEKLASEHENVRVVTHDKNRGYGGALKSGFASSRYEHIFYADGDGQFDLKEIERLLPLAPECDIAAGFRIKRNDPIHRVINGKAYNMLVRLLFGLKVRDIDCAFKIVKRKLLIPSLLKVKASLSAPNF